MGEWDVFIAEGGENEFYELSSGDEILKIKPENANQYRIGC